MASGYFYGNTVQSTWRAYGLWETSESETAMTIKLHGGFQSVGWGFDVSDVTCTVTNNGTAKSGTKDVSTGTGSTENVRIVSDNNKTINKTHSDQSITLKVYIDRTGGYKGGTSQKTTTITVPKKKSWTVSYNLNGGSGTAPSSQTKWYGETLKLSTATPSRTGYTFKGWATSASGSVAYASGANYTGNAALTLYAVWQLNTYAVTYNANKPSGASGTVSNMPTNQTKTYGQALTLSSTRPTLAEYNFTGWNTAANGSGTSYSPGGSYTGNSALTLYAQWVRAYDLPTISNLVVIRCTCDDTDPNNPVYTDDEEGESMRVAFSWEVDHTHGTGDGVATVVSIQWKKKTETSWTTMDITPSPAASSGSEIAYIQYYAVPAAPDPPVPFDKDLAYDVKITVTDNHGMTTTVQTLLSTTVYIFDIASGGLGLAIGKPIAPNGTGLQVAWDATFDGGVSANWLYINGGNATIASTGNGTMNKLMLTSTNDAEPTSDNRPALIIGPVTGAHIEIDQNEIIAKNSGTTATQRLYVGSTSAGPTSILGGSDITVQPASGNKIHLNGLQRSNARNTTLWSGAWYMAANQTANLSENVSAQAHGIVLAWSAYANGAAQNYSWNYTFVPKSHVIDHGGAGVSCIMIDPDRIGMKYVYVSDNKVAGNDRNDDNGNVSGTNNVKFSNNYWVLRAVYGV